MSAQYNDHDHDHDHSHEHEHAEHAVQAPLPPTPEHGYWKSLRELAGQASWQQQPSTREYPPGADQPPTLDPMSRRNFFHLMGASAGLAGLAAGAGCRRYEKEEIVPLARRPENQTPGTTLQYASVYDLAGVAHPVVATSFEGRPIHLDGNPDHPWNSGGIIKGTKRHAGLSTFAQASILHLYDPDRSQSPRTRASGGESQGTSLDSFKAALADVRKLIDQGGVRILSEASSSTTVAALRARLAGRVPWHEYEPLSWDNERVGTRMVFGRAVRPIARLEKAETIVTIDCDLFVEHPAAARYNRDYGRSRVGGSLGPNKMNRLWAVESVFSNTGAIADHRLPLRSEYGLPFAMALAAAVSGGGAPNAEFLKENKVQTFVSVLADELKKNAGRAVVLAGRRQPPEVHAVVAKINQALGAVGATLDYHEVPDADRPTHLQSITALTKDMAAGKVQALIILGGNPIYDAPADLDFAGALSKVATSIHLAQYNDETSLKCTWHVPQAHFLEVWGDARTWDGVQSIAQPLIEPLWGGLSNAELLSLLLGEEKPSLELVQSALGNPGNWRALVEQGFVPNSEFPKAQVTAGELPQLTLSPSQTAGSVRKANELEVVYHFSSNTYDGRFGNNAWLWETPDFLTKVTWDNYALVSPKTATQLGLANDTMITVKVGDKSIKLPCYTMPGQAPYSIALVLGGGRTAAGHVATHPHNVDHKTAWDVRVVGWNTYTVRQTTGFDFATHCSVSATGESYELANIQDHWDYRPGLLKDVGNVEIAKRTPGLIREVPAATFDSNKTWKAEEESDFWDDQVDATAQGKKPRHLSLFEEHEYKGHRWAMAIDLGTCTGCNACMVACQSENNVPVVGRKEVINNREMHWIRIDRYFQGNPDDPHVVHQPLACQQCENAPCEQVCPVGATSHSDEGLNDMAYNRCIGTRYCANNCPYKVRRFNFLDWNSEFRDARNKVRRLLFNPDVTVRMRGVMEKCTFCVQRIQNGKIKAKAQIRNGTRTGTVGEPLPDGEIETACQMACPTEAIVFGDLEDPNSRVSALHGDRRQYALLPDQYTKPRNRYLARVRNPNPKMPALPGVAAAGEGGEK
jgi:molybdopterin-containing oxidoreductase family iron-sulfur binding subunit